jgi:hypothetical protein
MPDLTNNAALSSNIGRLTGNLMEGLTEGEAIRKKGKVTAHPLHYVIVRYLWAISRAGVALPNLGDLRSIYNDAKSKGINPIRRFEALTEIVTPIPPTVITVTKTPRIISEDAHPVQQVLAEVMSTLDKPTRSEFATAITKFAWAHYKVEGSVTMEDVITARESCNTPDGLTNLAVEMIDMQIADLKAAHDAYMAREAA